MTIEWIICTMLDRHIQNKISKSLKISPAILLVGPRQSGKTTLMKRVSEQQKIGYASFDSIPTQAAAFQDPLGFVAELTKPIILDEIQRAPELLLAIKADIDANRQPGRYLLTGSANPLLVPKLGDALTGRLFIHQLWPLSQGEILSSEESFLSRLFSPEFGGIKQVSCSRHELLEKSLIGGFPQMQTLKTQEERDSWCDNYLSLALQKDIQDLARIESIAQLPNLLCMLAMRVGSLTNLSDLSNSAGIPLTTLRRYLQLLQSLFLLYILPAWHPNLSKRLTKAPKTYFSDTAILLNLLKMDLTRLVEAPHLIGGVIENFVVMELVKQISWHSSKIALCHGRLDPRTEIDLILEDQRQNIVGIEIKSSETVRADDFKHFISLKTLAKEKFLRGIVLYSGDQRLPFGPNQWAIPISELWGN